ncbi:helix-turn-helix domain-containing protein [Arthrobacter sp. CAN_C5]|uniref:helix-turn-helix domain-containing protein n=1 Tax=Arthrobacter sp. CAN_C5 TaxID=2760706 RepID=UPI001AE46479|nr:helix-turn-helix domain-containing protein [Arthrobacter sp. CAN_C5]MBP2216991.1 DNA-binding transcriptional ArsR family regulator [Arthrobacter sp. CAN_C5]
MTTQHNTADVVLHPVRLRIIQGFLGGRQLTTAQIAENLPEVTAATLYRHIATLAGAGILEVVGERRVRGAVERTYSLRLEASELSPEELASMTADQHKQAFTSFVAGLLGSFDQYLDEAARIDLVRDGVGYRQTAVWLSDQELKELADTIREAVLQFSDNAAEGRRRRLITTIVMPTL